MKKILLILILSFSFSACEKDDICSATNTTTPNMVLDFYNITNPSVKKSFAALRITAIGTTKNIDFVNASQVKIPLQLDTDKTSFSFTINGNDSNLSDDETDIIELNYNRTNIFVSRACGFKTTFTLKNNTGFVRKDIVDPALNYWIKSFEILNQTITNENEVHVKIFF